jgi:hypothetical protein
VKVFGNFHEQCFTSFITACCESKLEAHEGWQIWVFGVDVHLVYGMLNGCNPMALDY